MLLVINKPELFAFLDSLPFFLSFLLLLHENVNICEVRPVRERERG